ncbi:hypothetical protein FACS189467_6290 [Bacteroidia bacterium]|nr:hypothetical protein FACS189467_6290 [Bacteroidia bacterium]
MQKIKNWLQQNTPVLLLLFVLAVGLTGAINADVSKVIYGLSLVAFLIFCFNDIKLWIQQHSEAKTYFKILVFFTLYGFLLIAVWSFLPNKYNLKPTYGGIEELLFNYVLVPFFSLVIGLYLNQKMFERAMMLFSVCTALSGLFLLFVYFDLHILLNTPAVFFDNVLQCRFMSCGNRVSWIAILLKDYSFFPALGALVAAPFIVKYKGWYKLLAIVLLLINTLLLFLTINRGTIIGFVLALLIMFFYSLRILGGGKKYCTVWEE